MRQKISHFSKGIKESAALSFGLSAKSLCEKSCRMLQLGLCYAEKPEKRYKAYYKKLIRNRRTDPVNLLNGAAHELTDLPLKWFRFSVSGSLPLLYSLKYKKAFYDFCKSLIDRNVKIHCPVESKRKASLYRSIVADLPIVVRRTIQKKSELTTFNDCAAYVVGDTPGKHNIGPAFELAKELRQTKSVVVCPAIHSDSKCGKCTACANKGVDIVLYPLHS